MLHPWRIEKQVICPRHEGMVDYHRDYDGRTMLGTGSKTSAEERIRDPDIGRVNRAPSSWRNIREDGG